MVRDRTVAWRALGESSLIAAACWLVAFAAPFVAEASGRAVDALMAVAALMVFVSAVGYQSRKLKPVWAAYFGGVVFAGAIWAVSAGIYAEHEFGWQGLRMEDVDLSDLWMGTFFFAPTGAIPGVLLGLFASIASRRSRVATAS